ncbi:MAG TPA: ATP-binding cassette domain-containing protein [Chloroflexota bacterium]|jgi:simple sugar transport system ATP-binding protein|nr:ATP-binding cassette domain-containing protein [Chloroflexota bacterium]
MASEAPLVELRGVSKSFGKGYALQGINLRVGRPEIVGLVGDNGAGKSTMIRIISGATTPTSGEIYIKGQRLTHWSTARARLLGIETVYQDRALAEQQTIARNIFMGREITGLFGRLRLKRENEEAERLMRDIGFTSRVFAPDSIVGNLSGGEKQGVAIARALYYKAELIILDEPTNALSLTEVNKVLGFIRRIKEQGGSAIFITHNIYHAHDVADRLVILDRGRITIDIPKSYLTAEQLVEEMHAVARTGVFNLGRYRNTAPAQGVVQP